MTLPIVLTLIGCAVASYWDIRSRRIPNWLNAAIAIVALVVHSFAGLEVAAISLLTMFVVTLGGALLYARGGIGAGDIKLAIASCGMLSYPLCVPFLLYTAIGGGLLAVFFLLFNAESRPSFVQFAVAGTGGRVASRATLPYAVAFAFGAALIALAQSVVPFLRIAI